ncbi:hypothetical protein L1987_55545 [Smallanthus sonchifolius]|uniref:Uncharacterized protein n=1 Tax=Smallanthus sonchifolius TaxID=185202 RepID=A0ACB9EA21_9ASTR|nr:hypothetical protein L1987_55545 [Smallanthus sonchifolius]
MEWLSWVPLKLNFFVWRAAQDRIASKVALARRVSIWCKFPAVKFGSVKKIMQFSRNLNMAKNTKKAILQSS